MAKTNKLKPKDMGDFWSRVFFGVLGQVYLTCLIATHIPQVKHIVMYLVQVIVFLVIVNTLLYDKLKYRDRVAELEEQLKEKEDEVKQSHS